jgi:serine/threonine protein kinase
MPAPTSTADVLEILRKSQLVSTEQLESLSDTANDTDPGEVVRRLQADGLLTPFQAEQLLKGRHKGFVLGKYRLMDRIGMGGMGQVYLAEHATMKRRVAVKVLPPDRCKDEFARERFQREAKAAAAVEHPNIVRIYDLEMDGDVSYLVMEYIDGVTLHELVARRGKLEPGRAAHFLWQIANGLEAIHCFQLVHRDIKPANLLLDRAGVVRILDLGLVRSELDDDALTRGEGAKMLGTADYLAPEQAIECSKVDSRADLYSLGCTAYFLLTGQPPFPADKVSQKLIAHQIKPAEPIRSLNPAVPEGLAVVVHKLLAKKPDDRYRTSTDVLEALAPFVQPALPSEEDFPTPGSSSNFRSGISLNGWVSMNVIDRSGQGSASGSAIRFHSDTNPKLPASQAQQQTKSNAAQETLPARPGIPVEVPATPAPQPPVEPKPRRATKAPPAPVIELTVPPKPVPISDKGKSTALKADRLFRERPDELSYGWDRGRWIALALALLLIGVAVAFFQFVAK